MHSDSWAGVPHVGEIRHLTFDGCKKCGSRNRGFSDWLDSDGKPTGEYSYVCMDCGFEQLRDGDDS